MQWHAITDTTATCLPEKGTAQAGVYAYTGGDATKWVIALGDLVSDLQTTVTTSTPDGGNVTTTGMEMCIDEAHCEVFAKATFHRPPTKPLGAAIQSQDCKQNPTFCHFNHALLPSCDFALWMGAKDGVSTSGVPLKFRGLKVLAATIKLLGGLGLAKAEEVLLTGFNQGGQAVIYHADRIGAMLKPLAPNLKVYKALPVDGIHPAHSLMFFASLNLQVIFAQKQANMTNAVAAVPPACTSTLSSAQQWECLLTNHSLKYVKTPLYAVQQLASVWDAKCGVLDGLVTGWGAAGASVATLNQIVCDPPGNAWVVSFSNSSFSSSPLSCRFFSSSVGIRSVCMC